MNLIPKTYFIMSPITCHLSTTTATATATDPPTAYFPTSRLVQKISLFNQKSPAVSVWSATEGTSRPRDRQSDISTYRLNWPRVALVTGAMLQMICNMEQVTRDMRWMFFFFSSPLYQCYYLQPSKDSVSPVCS